MSATELRQKIADRTACVAVIGCGYVGLPLAVAFARGGFPVVALDLDQKRIAQLRNGSSYIRDVADEDLAPAVRDGRLKPTTNYDSLREADVIFVAVQTPFDRAKQPDLRFIVKAAEGISTRLRRGQLVILESTTYPGTTDEVMKPILERSGLRAGHDFFLAFSPERIDPGNKTYRINNTAKVVGGVDPESTELAVAILDQITEGHVHPVSSARVAEMTKLLENTFRSVNIALVNELAMLCDRMHLDVWEVIDAAATKPYGFMPFYPGPGVGGHCLASGQSVYARVADEAGPLTVEELWQSAVRDRRVETVGDVEVVTDPGFATLGIGIDGPPRWEAVTHLYRRRFIGDLVDIATVDGRRLTVTDRHPMLIVESGLLTRAAADLEPGDLLPVLAETMQVEASDPIVERAPWANASHRAHNVQMLGVRSSRAMVSGRPVTPVQQIERRPADALVYSIETADSHTFAMADGVFVHNCIPVDPYYLAWKAREFDFHTRFIELAAETNLAMPFFTAGRIRKLLDDGGKSLRGARVLTLGAAFKKDIDDARQSPAVRVMEILSDQGADLQYHDPYVPSVRLEVPLFADGRGPTLQSVTLDDDTLRRADCVVILVAHSGIDYGRVVRLAPRVFDAVNATRGLPRNEHVERL